MTAFNGVGLGHLNQYYQPNQPGPTDCLRTTEEEVYRLIAQSNQMTAGQNYNNYGLPELNTLLNQQTAGAQVPQRGEDNIFTNIGNGIAGGFDKVGDFFGGIPLVGGLMNAAWDFNGQVAALPFKAAGFAGKLVGGAVQLGGSLIQGVNNFVGGAIEGVGKVASGIGNGIAGAFDKVGDVLGHIPLVGGILDKGVDFLGEAVALPAKVVGGVVEGVGKVVKGVGNVVGGAVKAVGKFFSKL